MRSTGSDEQASTAGPSPREVDAECLFRTASRERASVSAVLVGVLAVVVAHWNTGADAWLIAFVVVRLVCLAQAMWVLRRIAGIGGECALRLRLDRRLELSLLLAGAAWSMVVPMISHIESWTAKDQLTSLLLLMATLFAVVSESHNFRGMINFMVGLWIPTLMFVVIRRDEGWGLIVLSILLFMAISYVYAKMIYTQARQGVVAELQNRVYANRLVGLNGELQEALAQATNLSSRDALTDCFNRRTFLNRAEMVAADARRRSEHASVLMLDLDHFKSINDLFGHLSGDDVLVEASKIMRHWLREVDILARWGGEEFVVLLPNASLDDGARVAERIRTAMASHEFPPPVQSGRVTVSIGVAGWPPDLPLMSAIAQADRALYRAKSKGRNRVEVASP